MSSSQFELIYFSIPGRGKIIRDILNYAKANWTETNPTWPSAKSSMPFGRLPVLIEIKESGEKFTLSESQVIERYLAQVLGLYPKDASPSTVANIDQYRDQYSDIFSAYIAVIFGKKEERRADFDLGIKTLVEKHEQILKDNGSNGHYVGNSTTYADVAAYSMISYFKESGFGDELTEDKAPELNNLIKTVGSEF